MKIYETDLVKFWETGNKFRLNGKKIYRLGKKEFRVGKMCYGDYFLEPLPEKPETEGFDKDTKWFKLVDNQKRIYEINLK